MKPLQWLEGELGYASTVAMPFPRDHAKKFVNIAVSADLYDQFAAAVAPLPIKTAVAASLRFQLGMPADFPIATLERLSRKGRAALLRAMADELDPPKKSHK